MCTVQKSIVSQVELENFSSIILSNSVLFNSSYVQVVLFNLNWRSVSASESNASFLS